MDKNIISKFYALKVSLFVPMNILATSDIRYLLVVVYKDADHLEHLHSLSSRAAYQVKSFDTISYLIQNDRYRIYWYHMTHFPQTLSSEISSLNIKSVHQIN